MVASEDQNSWEDSSFFPVRLQVDSRYNWVAFDQLREDSWGGWWWNWTVKDEKQFEEEEEDLDGQQVGQGVVGWERGVAEGDLGLQRTCALIQSQIL